MFEDLEIRMEWSTPTCPKWSQNSLLASSRSIQVSQPTALKHWKSKMRCTAKISFLCIYRSLISRKARTQAASAVAFSRTTNHSQSTGGCWGFTGTEGNLSLLLYHGSTMGRPNTSSRGSGDSEPKLEPLLSSPLPPGVATSLEMGGSPSSERVPLHLLADLREEEVIIGVQGREKEEKEKEKEEEGLGFACSEYVLWFWKNK